VDVSYICTEILDIDVLNKLFPSVHLIIQSSHSSGISMGNVSVNANDEWYTSSDVRMNKYLIFPELQNTMQIDFLYYDDTKWP